MSDIPKPTSAVLRRNAENECGAPVGQVNLVIQMIPGIQTVSFYCNQPRLHTDECRFDGTEVVVRARRRADGASALHLRPGS
jgi:hypothetical protein